MQTFRIQGGSKLNGDVVPQGAKNEALQIICATLLTSEQVVVSNIPNIIDVNKLINLLSSIGVKVNKINPNKYSFKAEQIDLKSLSSEKFKTDGKSIRGSIMIVGPLLARFGIASIPRPGGDKIGRRRLDTHFGGLIKLGAHFAYDKESRFYSVKAKKLVGTYILMEEASVTGTANIIMAASLAKGETTIYNAACEPYIQQLCKLLIFMGAKISGLGSNLLKINGVDSLGGANHKVLPDMIEIGSWIGLAAMTKSSIRIKNVSWENLGIIPNAFKSLGINLIKDVELLKKINGSTKKITRSIFERLDDISCFLKLCTKTTESINKKNPIVLFHA